MIFRDNTQELDVTLFDPEHDMDLILLANNARTDSEIRNVARMSRNRMRARRAAVRRSARSGAESDFTGSQS